ncbi:hypothetical protein ACIQZO_13090 [Streptomyces sp. NPDC097617]|uniref:hypothetical protein n=1 Tax=Streptomyces sp. NPDC097617 TaxID=3366091 RepID=UPI00380193E4
MSRSACSSASLKQAAAASSSAPVSSDVREHRMPLVLLDQFVLEPVQVAHGRVPSLLSRSFC